MTRAGGRVGRTRIPGSARARKLADLVTQKHKLGQEAGASHVRSRELGLTDWLSSAARLSLAPLFSFGHLLLHVPDQFVNCVL